MNKDNEMTIQVEYYKISIQETNKNMLAIKKVVY